MDTRRKIISFDEAVLISETRPVQWVSGHFDPLLAEHIRPLREWRKAGHVTIVVVTNPDQPLLPQRARVELVAALRDVDYVVQRNGLPSEQADDAAITRGFIERVLRRHRGEPT